MHHVHFPAAIILSYSQSALIIKLNFHFLEIYHCTNMQNEAGVGQRNGGGAAVLLRSGLTPEGKGIRHLESLNCIRHRSHVIQQGDVAAMGIILKIIFHGHLQHFPAIIELIKHWQIKKLVVEVISSCERFQKLNFRRQRPVFLTHSGQEMDSMKTKPSCFFPPPKKQCIHFR